MNADDSHENAVDAWLIRAAASGSAPCLIASFQAALTGIWTRAVRTLGSVTLDAVANRVLANAVQRYPFLEAIGPLPTGRIRCDELQLEERLVSMSFGELALGLRTVLVEILSLLGNITAEILTDELHAELAEAPYQEMPRHMTMEAGR